MAQPPNTTLRPVTPAARASASQVRGPLRPALQPATTRPQAAPTHPVTSAGLIPSSPGELGPTTKGLGAPGYPGTQGPRYDLPPGTPVPTPGLGPADGNVGMTPTPLPGGSTKNGVLASSVCCADELKLLQQQLTMLTQLRDILLVNTLIGGVPPITDMHDMHTGDEFALDTYVPIFQNKENRPVCIQLFALWGIAGAGLKISHDSSLSDSGLIDIFTEAGAFGKNTSERVIVQPSKSLYVRPWNPKNLAAMTNDSKIWVRVFDLQDLLPS